MISKKQYLKALNIVKEYEKQLRIGSVVRSTELKTVFFDDTWYGVTIEVDEIDIKNQYEFAQIVDILLTEKQQEEFTCNDTSREFKVHHHRIKKMFTYINSKKNVWRKK